MVWKEPHRQRAPKGRETLGIMVNVIKSKDANCEDCKKFEHLMPYGTGGKYICFDCAMKDEPGTRARYLKMIEGADTIIDHLPKTEN